HATGGGLDDVRFLVRRGGDLATSTARMVPYLQAAGDSGQARLAMEIDGPHPDPRFLRLLAAGGQALSARDGAHLAARSAETATVERVLADLMARSREGEEAHEAVRLLAALLDLPP